MPDPKGIQFFKPNGEIIGWSMEEVEGFKPLEDDTGIVVILTDNSIVQCTLPYMLIQDMEEVEKRAEALQEE